MSLACVRDMVQHACCLCDVSAAPCLCGRRADRGHMRAASLAIGRVCMNPALGRTAVLLDGCLCGLCITGSPSSCPNSEASCILDPAAISELRHTLLTNGLISTVSLCGSFARLLRAGGGLQMFCAPALHAHVCLLVHVSHTQLFYNSIG